MPLIPQDPNNLPTTFEIAPEDTIVKAVIRECQLALKFDKKDNAYFVVRYEILSPEWEGREITDFYVGFPDGIEPNMTDAQVRRANEKGIRMSQIVHSFSVSVDGNMPVNPINISDEVEKDEINEWLSQFVGCEGEFSLSVNEYQGRKSNKIKMYLLP